LNLGCGATTRATTGTKAARRCKLTATRADGRAPPWRRVKAWLARPVSTSHGAPGALKDSSRHWQDDGGARVLRSSRHLQSRRAARGLGRHATPHTGLRQPVSTLTSNEQKTERSVFHGAGWPVTLCRALVDDLQPCFSVTAQAGPGPGPFSGPGRKVETLAVNGYAHGTWLCVTSQ
jgi:hypothetical protein